MMFSNPFKKKEVDYEELEGAAQEAGQAALKGEVSCHYQHIKSIEISILRDDVMGSNQTSYIGTIQERGLTQSVLK